MGWDWSAVRLYARGGVKGNMDLTAFRQHVRSLAMRRDGQPVYNATVDRTSIVIESLLSNARYSVDILTGTLDPNVYGRDPVIKEAQFFLLTSPENRIRIILEEDSPSVRMLHPLLVALKRFKNVDVKLATEGVQRRYGYHFIVTDNDNYRFESDKRKPAAVACFGHAEGGESLRTAYDTLWAQCSGLSRPLHEAPMA